MENLIKNLLREELLLTEDMIYNPKITKVVTDRIGDDSDETLNKLAIIGIYRNHFGNEYIQEIKTKGQVDQSFDNWYKYCIEEMLKTEEFTDDKESATKFLDAYVKNIKSVDKHVGFSMRKMKKFAKNLEKIVRKEKWVEDDTIKPKATIYKPDADDVSHEDENVVILNTDTKAKCVMYGTDETWCITKAEENYYNSYRIDKGATPYFVLQKNEPSPTHKLVIMHYESGYAIADQTNSPPRAGGDAYTNGPWSEIESQIPNLKGLERFFPYREITEDERRYAKVIREARGFDGDDLQSYIDDVIEGLVINGSQIEAPDFIRDYAAAGSDITDNQIKSLREEVISSLVEGGYFLRYGTEKQIELLSNKHQLRVIRLKINNGRHFTIEELKRLPLREQHEFIRTMTPNQYEMFQYYLDKVEGYKEIMDHKVKNLDPMSLLKFASISRVFTREFVTPEIKKNFNSNLKYEDIDEVLEKSNELDSLYYLGNLLDEELLRYIAKKNYEKSASLLGNEESPTNSTFKSDNFPYLQYEHQKRVMDTVLVWAGDDEDRLITILKGYDNPEELVNNELTGIPQRIDKFNSKFIESISDRNMGEIIGEGKNTEGLFRIFWPLIMAKGEELEDGEVKQDFLDSKISSLINWSKDPVKIINLLGPENMSKITWKGIYRILFSDYIHEQQDVDRTEVIKVLGTEILNTLDGYYIKDLLLKTDKPIVMAKALGSEILLKLSRYDIQGLLIKTTKPATFIKIFKKGISKFDGYDIREIIKDSKKPTTIIKNLGPEIMNKLSDYDIQELLSYSKKPTTLIKSLGSEIIGKLDSYYLREVLTKSKNPSDIINSLGPEIMGEMRDGDLRSLIQLSKDPSVMILALGKEAILGLSDWYLRSAIMELEDENERRKAIEAAISLGVDADNLNESTITKESLNEFRRLGGLPLL